MFGEKYGVVYGGLDLTNCDGLSDLLQPSLYVRRILGDQMNFGKLCKALPRVPGLCLYSFFLYIQKSESFCCRKGKIRQLDTCINSVACEDESCGIVIWCDNKAFAIFADSPMKIFTDWGVFCFIDTCARFFTLLWRMLTKKRYISRKQNGNISS